MSGILLMSGKMYDYENPDSNDFNIEDIALGLSNICRFAGQVPIHYSVAQHSVYVSYCIDPEYALEGLMHDATEAFLVDIPTPLKRLLPDYKRMEALHEESMMRRFGLPFPLRQEVHVADRRVFAAEVRDLRGDHEDHYGDYLKDVKPFEWLIDPWCPEEAEEAFIERYAELLSYRVIN